MNEQGLITQDPSTDSPWWSDWYSGMSSFADSALDTAATWFNPETNPVYQGVVHGVQVVYSDVREGVMTLGSDVIEGTSVVGATALKGADAVLDVGTGKLLLILGALAVGLYFIGKTGAIKVSI